MAHWSLIVKRIFRRFKYVFNWRVLWGWDFESCGRCGHCFRIIWKTTDEKWVEVMGSDDGCLCVDCFVEVAWEKNIEIRKHEINMELFNPNIHLCPACGGEGRLLPPNLVLEDAVKCIKCKGTGKR